MVGKTNLDQFAAGLVGTRTPYGTARNPFDDRFIPGGSSSGSGAAVGGGLLSFALGTDTAGSGAARLLRSGSSDPSANAALLDAATAMPSPPAARPTCEAMLLQWPRLQWAAWLSCQAMLLLVLLENSIKLADGDTDCQEVSRPVSSTRAA